MSLVEYHANNVDFGRTSNDYAKYRPALKGPPESFYSRIQQLLSKENEVNWDWKEKKILDVGTGPGLVALALAKKGAQVIGVDISENQVKQANESAKEMGVEKNCRFETATAEVTKQQSGTFDMVIACTAWHWFDKKKASEEFKRVLKPNGFVVLVQYTYLRQRSVVVDETVKLVLKYNPDWPMANINGLYPEEVDQLVVEGGLDLVEQFSYDNNQEFTHESWRGRIRTCNGVGSGILSEEKVKEYDQELKNLLKEKFPDPSLQIWHRVWCVVGRNTK